MKIIDHRLCYDDETPYSFRPSPNKGGHLVAHDLLVIHCTAGQSAKAAVEWLTTAKSKASAHLVISRTGEITQLLPFDTIAFHTGRSEWKGRIDLANRSLGIELDNPGRLKKAGGKWIAWFKREYPQMDLIKAIHKNDTMEYGWHKYSEIQIEVTTEVAGILVRHYSITDVVGHDEISPRRKWDPGPAFPMESFREEVSRLSST